MSEPTQEELIERLEEDRNYPPGGIEGVKENVRAKILYLQVAREGDQPLIRKTKNHMIVAGSAKVARNGSSAASQALNQALMDYMDDGGTEKALEVLDDLLTNPETDNKVRMQAVDFCFLRISGVPDRNPTPNESAALIALVERMQQGKLNEPRSISEQPHYGIEVTEVE